MSLLLLLASLLVGPAFYGQDTSITYTLEKRASQPTLAVFCGQDGERVYLLEKRLDRRVLTDTVTVIIDNEHSGPLITAPLDETRPAMCSAVVFQERRGNHDAEALTPWTFFEVRPGG